jgi:hypothetical protein
MPDLPMFDCPKVVRDRLDITDQLRVIKAIGEVSRTIAERTAEHMRGQFSDSGFA